MANGSVKRAFFFCGRSMNGDRLHAGRVYQVSFFQTSTSRTTALFGHASEYEPLLTHIRLRDPCLGRGSDSRRVCGPVIRVRSPRPLPQTTPEFASKPRPSDRCLDALAQKRAQHPGGKGPGSFFVIVMFQGHSLRPAWHGGGGGDSASSKSCRATCSRRANLLHSAFTTGTGSWEGRSSPILQYGRATWPPAVAQAGDPLLGSPTPLWRGSQILLEIYTTAGGMRFGTFVQFCVYRQRGGGIPRIGSLDRIP